MSYTAATVHSVCPAWTVCTIDPSGIGVACSTGSAPLAAEGAWAAAGAVELALTPPATYPVSMV